MRFMIYLSLLIPFALCLMSCAGHDNQDHDTIPPIDPVLVYHLGDTGDQPVSYEGQPVILSDDNNGIDTVTDGNWIRILWDPFKDTDLSHVKIYRFDEFNPSPVQIDSISSANSYYLDAGNDLIERVWYSYFIDLVDTSGNTARSDTVSYGLLSKSILLSPENSATIAPVGATFRWHRSGTASKYRLIILDENSNYIWHQDIMEDMETDPISAIMPANLAQQYSGQSLRWRVDSFDVEGEKIFGSESNEWVVNIQ
jgi:hypothetical protein